VLGCAKRLDWIFSDKSNWTRHVCTWIEIGIPSTSNRKQEYEDKLKFNLWCSGAIVFYVFHGSQAACLPVFFYYGIFPSPTVPCPFSYHFLPLYLVELWTSSIHFLIYPHIPTLIFPFSLKSRLSHTRPLLRRTPCLSSNQPPLTRSVYGSVWHKEDSSCCSFDLADLFMQITILLW
jgi:hypothetical protein